MSVRAPVAEFRPADTYLGATQAAQACAVSLSSFGLGVQAGEWPAPYHAAPDAPRWLVSELAASAAAKDGRVPAALLRHLPMGPDGKRVYPPAMIEALACHGAEAERMVARLADWPRSRSGAPRRGFAATTAPAGAGGPSVAAPPSGPPEG